MSSSTRESRPDRHLYEPLNDMESSNETSTDEKAYAEKPQTETTGL